VIQIADRFGNAIGETKQLIDDLSMQANAVFTIFQWGVYKIIHTGRHHSNQHNPIREEVRGDTTL